jgi:hypothetical protein
MKMLALVSLLALTLASPANAMHGGGGFHGGGFHGGGFHGGGFHGGGFGGFHGGRGFRGFHGNGGGFLFNGIWYDGCPYWAAVQGLCY